MRSEALKDFIREHAVLFWYSPDDKTETVSDELLVETILNYGDLDAVRKLFDIMGIQKTAAIFRGMTGRKKAKLFPGNLEFLQLIFQSLCALKFLIRIKQSC